MSRHRAVTFRRRISKKWVLVKLRGVFGDRIISMEAFAALKSKGEVEYPKDGRDENTVDPGGVEPNQKGPIT